MKRLFCACLLISASATAFATPHSFFQQLANAALERTNHQVRYDGRYVAIDYPNGDVPPHIGVCTDVVIRSYRTLNIDLQRLVHEDMSANFQAYPAKQLWGQTKPDSNIDHRRVPNLATFFARHGETLPITSNSADYQAGDIVTWRLSNNLPHIGIVVGVVGGAKENANEPAIVHNIGAGPVVENALFSHTITGHFRYINGNQRDTMRRVNAEISF